MRKFLIILLCLILVLGSVSVCFADTDLIEDSDIPVNYLIGKSFTFNELMYPFSEFSNHDFDVHISIEGFDFYHSFSYLRQLHSPYNVLQGIRSDDTHIDLYDFNSNTLSDAGVFTFTIIGGSDVNNLEFINWLYDNTDVPRYVSPTNTIFDSLSSIFNFATSTISTIGNSILNNTILLIPCVCGIAFVGVLLLKRFLFIGV